MAPVLGVLGVSVLLASGAGAGVAYVAKLIAAPPAAQMARAPELPPLLLPPTKGAEVARFQQMAPSAPPSEAAAHQDAAAVQVPLPPSFAAALAEQRAEIDRLQAQLATLVDKAGRATPAAPSAGPPPLVTMGQLPAVDIAQRPEPKKPRENLLGPPLAAPPPAPDIQRRAPVLAAQRGQTEVARAQSPGAGARPDAPRHQEASPSRSEPRAVAQSDGIPRSYKFEALERIRVGDTIPDWGVVSAVSRDANGGISIRTESGIIRKDPP